MDPPRAPSSRWSFTTFAGLGVCTVSLQSPANAEGELSPRWAHEKLQLRDGEWLSQNHTASGRQGRDLHLVRGHLQSCGAGQAQGWPRLVYLGYGGQSLLHAGTQVGGRPLLAPQPVLKLQQRSQL